mgnify:CR=1 FL=1
MQTPHALHRRHNIDYNGDAACTIHMSAAALKIWKRGHVSRRTCTSLFAWKSFCIAPATSHIGVCWCQHCTHTWKDCWASTDANTAPTRPNIQLFARALLPKTSRHGVADTLQLGQLAQKHMPNKYCIVSSTIARNPSTDAKASVANIFCLDHKWVNDSLRHPVTHRKRKHRLVQLPTRARSNHYNADKVFSSHGAKPDHSVLSVIIWPWANYGFHQVRMSRTLQCHSGYDKLVW